MHSHQHKHLHAAAAARQLPHESAAVEVSSPLKSTEEVSIQAEQPDLKVRSSSSSSGDMNEKPVTVSSQTLPIVLGVAYVEIPFFSLTEHSY